MVFPSPSRIGPSRTAAAPVVRVAAVGCAGPFARIREARIVVELPTIGAPAPPAGDEAPRAATGRPKAGSTGELRPGGGVVRPVARPQVRIDTPLSYGNN